MQKKNSKIPVTANLRYSLYGTANVWYKSKLLICYGTVQISDLVWSKQQNENVLFKTENVGYNYFTGMC